MRLEDTDGAETGQLIGAVVVRTGPAGEVLLDFGPADGPPLMRLRMSQQEASELSVAVKSAADGGSETVLIVDG